MMNVGYFPVVAQKREDSDWQFIPLFTTDENY